MKTHDARNLLALASEAISDRASQRDLSSGERSMERAVHTFWALTGTALTEREGWLFMVALKLSRSQQGALRLDDYIDAAAYCALAGESAAGDTFDGDAAHKETPNG